MPLSFKLFGAGLLLFFVGIFVAQKHMRLAIWGKTVEARMGETWESSGGRRGSKSLIVQYLFFDEGGKPVRGGDSVSTDWQPPADEKLQIVYLPSDPSVNKLASNSGLNGYIMLVVSIGLMAAGAWYFNRESVVEAHAETEATMERMRKKT
ncbi:MAG TPA: hypothetical protein VEJ63_21190, partial [Planctomycetota bacterium]|nr:hypothetical protein [Planctomycetota bacterium]